jgi:hypothetical protein
MLASTVIDNSEKLKRKAFFFMSNIYDKTGESEKPKHG